MNCTDLRDHYEFYALGLAEEPERSEIREHLDRGCEVCMLEIKRARDLVALLGGTPTPAAPSPKLRRRILASVGAEEPRRFGWSPFLAGATAMCLAAAVYFGGREWDFSRQVLVLRAQSRSQIIELTRLNEAFAILNGADTTVTSFGEKQPVPKGKLFVNPSLGFLMIASNLPQAPAGKTYELWLIPRAKGSQPVRAGTFQTDSNGAVMHMEHAAVDTASTAYVAVTMEVEGGVDAPTTKPVIVAPVGPALQ